MKRDHLPIYQTRSTRVLNLDDLRRPRRQRLLLALGGLALLIALAAVIGQGLGAAAQPGTAPTAGARADGAREQVLRELAATARPAAAAPTAPVLRPTAVAATAGAISVTGTGGEGLRLRSEPSLAATLLAVLEERSAVVPTGRRVEADGLAWVEVQAAGLQGWAAADYLR